MNLPHDNYLLYFVCICTTRMNDHSLSMTNLHLWWKIWKVFIVVRWHVMSNIVWKRCQTNLLLHDVWENDGPFTYILISYDWHAWNAQESCSRKEYEIGKNRNQFIIPFRSPVRWWWRCCLVQPSYYFLQYQWKSGHFEIWTFVCYWLTPIQTRY